MFYEQKMKAYEQMINIIINNKSYNIPQSCETISIKQFQIVAKWNEYLKNIDSIPQKQIQKESLIFIKEICRVECSVARKTKVTQRVEFIKNYTAYINSIIALYSQNIKPQKYITWRGEKLRFPKNEISFEGQKMPMAKLSAIEFCEASDLYMCDNVKYATLIMAILCRQKKQKYDEIDIIKRAKKMYGIPLSALLYLYAQINETHAYLKEIYPLCYQKPIDNNKISKTKFTWSDIIMAVAEYRPLEIKKIEQIHAYELLRVFNGKLKSI